MRGHERSDDSAGPSSNSDSFSYGSTSCSSNAVPKGLSSATSLLSFARFGFGRCLGVVDAFGAGLRILVAALVVGDPREWRCDVALFCAPKNAEVR